MPKDSSIDKLILEKEGEVYVDYSKKNGPTKEELNKMPLNQQLSVLRDHLGPEYFPSEDDLGSKSESEINNMKLTQQTNLVRYRLGLFPGLSLADTTDNQPTEEETNNSSPTLGGSSSNK
jgi:hypothetical protein